MSDSSVEVSVTEHLLYGRYDRDAPDQIRDNNGEVCLGLCRRCGRAESELSEPCDGGTVSDDVTPLIVYGENVP
jgi:hypothetical protein